MDVLSFQKREGRGPQLRIRLGDPDRDRGPGLFPAVEGASG